MTASYPDADRHTHCGYRFEGGAYCRSASTHPVHEGKWGGREPGHEYVPEPHRWPIPRCIDCGQPSAGAA